MKFSVSYNVVHTCSNEKTLFDILHDEPGLHVMGMRFFTKVITGVGSPSETHVSLTTIPLRRQPNEEVRLTEVGGTIEKGQIKVSLSLAQYSHGKDTS